MPPGGLYAKWDAQSGKGIWFFSEDRDYAFREPRCQSVLYEERNLSRFRSLIFRLGSLADDELCGAFEFQRPGLTPKRYTVHSSFYPEAGIGLWIAITSKDEQDATSNSRTPSQPASPSSGPG